LIHHTRAALVKKKFKARNFKKIAEKKSKKVEDLPEVAFDHLSF
jgi:hypothetical protein